jgi:osmotically-inducible protein OsmY
MADIGAEVANALHWDFAIPRHRVTAEVDAGVVTLRGIVERAYLRSHAEAIVRRVSGVTGVENKIAVRAAEDLRQRSLHH